MNCDTVLLKKDLIDSIDSIPHLRYLVAVCMNDVSYQLEQVWIGMAWESEGW